MKKPYTLIVQPDHIPAVLKEKHQWVAWRMVMKQGKWTKVPCQVSGKMASSTNRKTWNTFHNVLEAYNNGSGFDGVGIVLTKDLGIVGHDIDNCVTEDGELNETADLIVMTLDTYTEYSPSGTGIRAFSIGTKPEGGCRKGNVEMYDSGRFLTVTGEALSDKDISANQDGINAVYNRYIGGAVVEKAESDTSPMTTADKDLCRKIAKSKQQDKFKALFNGNLGGYDSHSEARMALLQILSYWTRNNSQQIDRIFRSSKLYTEKWDSKRGNTTLGAFEIGKAISECDETNKTEDKPVIEIFTLRDYLQQDFGEVEVFVGQENDALMVPGEGTFMPGQGNVGKTPLVSDFGIKLTCGFNILRWQVNHPLRVLIFQAELPNQFYQQRLSKLIEHYRLGSPKAELAYDNLIVANISKTFNIHAKGNGAEVLGEWVDKTDADVVILDPFLSFYDGDENINPEVRRSLDRIKYEVLAPLNCHLIITDHQPKYSDDAKNTSQKHSMRGAGAKRDFASTVLAVSPSKTPDGEHGAFINVTVDKMRYGPKPKNGFKLSRNFSFMHELWTGINVSSAQVAEIVSDNGGELTKNNFLTLLMDEYQVSRHKARELIEIAISDGKIDVIKGNNNAQIHILK